MKVLEILKEQYNMLSKDTDGVWIDPEKIDEAIKELEFLQNENKSLVKTLEKYNEEMIDMRKENQDLLNTVIEAQKVIKNVLGSRRWKKSKESASVGKR